MNIKKIAEEIAEVGNLHMEWGDQTQAEVESILSEHLEGEWVKTSKLLPKDFSSALIAHTQTHDGSLVVEEAYWDGRDWTLARTDPCDDAIQLRDQVIYWREMPLPPSPDEETR